MQPLQPGDPGWVGGYRLVARLGAGGMGVVYLGHSRGGRAVAVKVVREHFARDTHYRARFRREVAAARTVTGTFSAPLLDADPEAEVPWLVTDYLPGLSLREAVEVFGGLPPDTLRLLAAALAEALAAIHRAGLAHRDLKPGNIMLTAVGPRVIDFGIARPDGATSITLPGALPGTPGFMSPEQASGGLAGPASDVFALGAVLAFAATGQEPFDADDRAATLERVRLARPDLSGLTDRGLRALVAACLRREPGQRPSAAALLDRLDRLDRLGKPAASVQGTRWLPAPLAEAIDARVARTEPPESPESPESPAAPVLPAAALAERGALAGGTTVDPVAVTRGPLRIPGIPGIPALGDPGRRRLLLAMAAVPVGVGAAVVLGESLLSESEASTSPRTSGSGSGSRSPSPSRSATGPTRPPQAALRWKTKVIDKDDYRSPDLYRAGGVVLATHSGQTDVRALDPRTGKILWSRPTDVGPADKVTAGADAVYLFDARKEEDQPDSVMRAVDPASGAVRWTYRVPFGFPWGAVATGSVVCVAVGNEVTALGAKDGKQRWTARATGMSVTARAGLVVAMGDGVLTGVDARSGRIRWTYEVGDSPPFSLVSDGLVFARDQLGTVYAVRADDGKTAWKKPLDYRSSMRWAGDGLVFVDDVDGPVRALRADTGKPVWSRQLGGQSGQGGQSEANPYGAPSTLGLSGGTLWVASNSDQTVYALDSADGRVQWTYGAQASSGSDQDAASGALAIDGLVLLATQGGHVEAVSPPGAPGQPGSSRPTNSSNGGPRGAT